MADKKENHRRRGKGCALNGWLAIPCGFSAEMMARAGWDALTIDMQHGLIDYPAMVAMLTASAANADIPTLVRAPWLEEGILMKVLDAGAAGVICPMINTRDDAERLAAATRYPPLGRRSFGPIRARLAYGENYAERANDIITVWAMIETAQAVENADAILSVPGIDGVYIGPGDLAYSLGCPDAPHDSPEVMAAVDGIVAAARRNKKRIGIHATSSAFGKKMHARGDFDMLTVQSDARLLSAAAANLVAEFRRL